MRAHSSASARSRSSQSHSASASVSSSARNRRRSSNRRTRRFPYSYSDCRDDAVTSNDELESVSVNDSEEVEVGDDEEDNASMQTCIENKEDSMNRELKSDSSLVKIDSSTSVETGKEGREHTTSVTSAWPLMNPISGTVVKEDSMKEIFSENLWGIGAFAAREEKFKREEEAGILKFVWISNDGIDQHLIWLITLKNVFARQLPKMPKEYIVRLMMDRYHKSLVILKHNKVIGGITYRPHVSLKFGEISFCAIGAGEQEKGYGTRLMCHLKQHARDVDGLTHFLTFADNNAVTYFKKQGFSEEIELEKEKWKGCIKGYEGVVLMECKLYPKFPYTDVSTVIRRQRQAIDEKIRGLSNRHIVYPGIDFQRNEDGISRKIIKVEDIPGLREAGWTPDASTESIPVRRSLHIFMSTLLKTIYDSPDAWPFKEPVDSREVPDYYEIIKDPIDLRTMMNRLESEQYYVTFEMFVTDVERMFDNARKYNSPETIYYKCATRLKNYFLSKIQACRNLQ